MHPKPPSVVPDPTDSQPRRPARTLVGAGIFVTAFVALLVAVSYPVVTAALAAGVLMGSLVMRVVHRRRHETRPRRICLPMANVCIKG